MLSVSQASVSLLFAQVGVEGSTEQEQRDTDPGQDEAVPKVSSALVSGTIQDLLPVEGEDEAGGKVRETWNDGRSDGRMNRQTDRICFLPQIYVQKYIF